MSLSPSLTVRLHGAREALRVPPRDPCPLQPPEAYTGVCVWVPSMHTVLRYMGLGHCFLLDFVVLFSKVRLGVGYCSTIRLKDLPTSSHVWGFPMRT